MQKEWSEIFTLHRVSGVKSKKKYLGCAQSHINSIRLAFSLFPQQPYCIVLEDDVKPLRSRDYFESLLEKLSQNDTRNELDCLSLNSTFDRKVIKEKFNTIPSLDFLVIDPKSNLMSGSSFMIYSRRLLERISEYQRHLETSSFIIPNDRLFTTSSYGIYHYSPLICAVPKEQVCDFSELAAVSDNFGGGKYSDHVLNLEILIQNSNTPSSIHSELTSDRLDIRLLPLYLALFFGVPCVLAVTLVIIFVTYFNSKQSSIIQASAQGSLI